MLEIVIKLVAAIIVLLGVILIYDARIITDKIFGFGDKNEAAGGLKILGVLIYIETLGIIIGINNPSKIGIISSYMVCGTIALFGKWEINTKTESEDK